VSRQIYCRGQISFAVLGLEALRWRLGGCDFIVKMVACTLDYRWRHYVVASLVSLFGGVVVLLPIRLVWYVLEASRSVSVLRYTLCHVQSRAEAVLNGNSTINKIIVRYHCYIMLIERYLECVHGSLWRNCSLCVRDWILDIYVHWRNSCFYTYKVSRLDNSVLKMCYLFYCQSTEFVCMCHLIYVP